MSVRATKYGRTTAVITAATTRTMKTMAIDYSVGFAFPKGVTK
jgi:hypothetical protein